MEKGKAAEEIATSLKKLSLNPNLSSESPRSITTFQSSNDVKLSKIACWVLSMIGLIPAKNKPPSLVSLCLGVVGQHLEDLITDLGEIAVGFPPYIKMAIAAISRRRKLLNDDVIISLADPSWEILDLSGSDITDSGLIKVAEICKFLRAVDISRCDKISPTGVSVLIRHCKSLQTLRCGGCPRSDYTARNCLYILKPRLIDVEGDSWEDLDTAEIGYSAESLRWLVWSKIDKNSLEMMSSECPRIIVNPKPSPLGFKGTEVPSEALPYIALDEVIVKDIDPKTWATCGVRPKPVVPSLSSSTELSMAEKFRLAFVERDTRLAPKRAKNVRQHKRRAEREWMMTSAEAKALALASKAGKSIHKN